MAGGDDESVPLARVGAAASEETVVDAGAKDEKAASADAAGEKPAKRVSILQLFRFATPLDTALMCAGLAAAALHGTLIPLQNIFLGEVIQAVQLYDPRCDAADPAVRGAARAVYDGAECGLDAFQASVRTTCTIFAVLGAIQFLAVFVHNMIFSYTSQRQSTRVRVEFLRALLSQEQGFFDAQTSGDLVTRMTSDVLSIQDGIGPKFAQIVQNIASFFGGIIIGFVRGWQMGLVTLAGIPFILATGAIIAVVLGGAAAATSAAYAAAGACAAEALSAIRTVAAFGGERREEERYFARLAEAAEVTRKSAWQAGIAFGGTNLLIFWVFALGLWFASVLVENGTYDQGRALGVFFTIISGSFGLSVLGVLIPVVATAQGAAAKIFEHIDRASQINPFAAAGSKPASIQGRIEFRGVSFSYPTRPGVAALEGLDLAMEPGQTVALVGSSGSGKSTVVRLIDRFYDPQGGAVLLDGVDLRELNVGWLRSQVGVVSQEPVLFDRSIRENILLGLQDGAGGADRASLDAMVVEAAKAANAHGFISSLPDGYETVVGAKGGKLSGGQKQRVAIARAIIGNPRILLLDEATSALDTASERTVQAALDSASKCRTTVIVAHRLSTIKNADTIVVMIGGKIVEKGNHATLKAAGGVYTELVKAQELRHVEEQNGGAAHTSRKPSHSLEAAPAEEAEEESGDSESDEKVALASAKDSDDAQTVETGRKPLPWSWILTLARREWPLYSIGILGALINGGIYPATSVFFAGMVNALKAGNPNLRSDANVWVYAMIAIGILSQIANVMQFTSFRLTAANMTMELRRLSFRSLLRQEMAFFDDANNSVGALTTKLAADAGLVDSLVGGVLGTIFMAFATTAAGIILVGISGWQLLLVVFAVYPLLLLQGYFETRNYTDTQAATSLLYQKSSRVATEALQNIRAVAILHKEDVFLDSFSQRLDEPFRRNVRAAIFTSLGLGISFGIIYWTSSLLFYVGSKLVVSGTYTSVQLVTTFFAATFAAQQTGNAFSFFPDLSKARVATIAIHELVTRKSLIDATKSDGNTSQNRDGAFDFNGVSFAYPTRPDARVLETMTFEALAGKTVALVGPSGCGKSTAVSLDLRFYDTTSGAVHVEGLDVRDWTLSSLRREMAVVGQEPVLFSHSIHDNIAYGLSDDDGLATQEQVEAAARAANAHDFVLALPQGYATNCGEAGSLLSGGQKQRIALARALIRHPKLLLLDEATSALDSESERVVDMALKAASKGRTTLTIAHRLASVQDADVIFVVERGAVVESGSHADLLKKGGKYYELVQHQRLDLH